MCGISGFYSFKKNINAEQGAHILKEMCNSIINRGPDADGYWCDFEQSLFLGHRRLSILDLSEAGKQPMVSANKKYVIIFNGEIYNHLEIRKEIEKLGGAPIWKGHSDTETLLAGFELWGVEKTICKCIGMFAFAVWNTEEKILILGRDRVGEKPLYYGWLPSEENLSVESKNIFIFGSQLKSFKKHPGFKPSIDRNALSLFFRHNYIPSPHTIYEGIYKLEPGTLLSISDKSKEGNIMHYWSAENIAKDGIMNPFKGTFEEAVEDLEYLLRDAIKMQMLSDVPLGAFLSGGIDSSTIVALMQAQTSAPVKTFTIGFNEKGYDEANFAKQVAQYLGTDHTELYITSEQAMNIIHILPEIYDEPFSDSSQIPTYLVSKLTRNHVTVSLSGDAGDELFCGYNRYLVAQKVWNKLNHFPIYLRKELAQVLINISPTMWDRMFKKLPILNKYSNIGDKIHKSAGVLGSKSISELYWSLISHWNPSTDLVINSVEPISKYRSNSLFLNELDDVQKMMFLDTITYLPDDILTKVDRAAMAVSLETRVPFLDHRIIEYAWKMPQVYKMKDGVTKLALREVLYKYIPKKLIERPKMGFGIPLDQWLRGPLKLWVEDLISEEKIRKEGLLNYDLIRDKWNAHLTGKRNWAYHIWDIVMFQAWLEKNKQF